MEDSGAHLDGPEAWDEETEAPARLGSLDAYRGLAMFLMVAEALHLRHVAEARPDNVIWQWLSLHQSHVAWVGCTVHDMIQPSFSFMVGVALPFSLASRKRKGQSPGWMKAHAFWRALVLILLGIGLRSLHRDQTYFTFEDTLTQIGLGYGFLFLLGLRPQRTHWIALVAILVGYWAAFAVYPAPGADYDYEAVGVPQDWPHLMEGFESHWNKNANLAHAFDCRFLNWFPRTDKFTHNGGGYQTLSFIPTLATMIMGLIAGTMLRSYREPLTKVGWLLLLGGVFLALGLLLEYSGLCPLVKRIWTPSFAIYSGGWCFIILAGMYLLIDVIGWKKLAFPLVVIGMNSIAIYVMDWTFAKFVHDVFLCHFGHGLELIDPAYHTLVTGSVVVATLWLVLYWMYRRKVFLRI